MASATEPEPYLYAALGLPLVLSFSGVGAVVAASHPRNPIGWIFCGVGLVGGLGGGLEGYTKYWLAGGSGPRSLGEAAAWFVSWSWIPLVLVPATFLLLLFPDGKLPSPRWRPVAWCAGAGIIGFIVGESLNAGPLGDYPQLANPYGIESLVVDVIQGAAAFLVAGSVVASGVSMIVRMRRAGTEQRQQIKWLAYAGVVAVSTILVSSVVGGLWSETVANAMILATLLDAMILAALLGLPASTGIAILRYRLYDIDLVINRTLVYGSLTAMLAAVYFGGVVSLQYAFRALTGQGSQIAIVASTLAIAALFNPLRRRVQAFVDRRFYRRKYDAVKTLEAFSAKLRDETNLDALNEELLSVVQETMQPAHASLWLRPDPVPKSSGGEEPSELRQ
jgi:hypothetical protein